jgi:hypothetical protein
MESFERAPLHIHDDCQSRYEKLEAKLKKLTEALEFYADESTYENWYIHGPVLYEEKAEIARKALEGGK